MAYLTAHATSDYPLHQNSFKRCTLYGHEKKIFDIVMLWAACCLGFFGFLRAGELNCTHTKPASDTVLSLSDVAIDSRDTPQVLVVHLRHSKTDPLGVGAHLYLGRTGSILCPLTAVQGYSAIRPPIMAHFSYAVMVVHCQGDI